MAETKIVKTIVIIVIISVVVWFLYLVRDILIPFILSGVFAYILSPLVTRLQSRGLKRGIAVSLLYLFFLLVFGGGVILLVPRMVKEASVLKNNLPQYRDKATFVFSNFQKNIEKKYPAIKEKALIDTGTKKIQQFFEKELSKIPGYLAGIFSIFSLFVLIPVITFFFLLSGRKIIDRLFKIIPSKYVETTLSLICEIDETLGKFIHGQIIEASLVGILSIIGLLILKVDYAILIGIVAGLANMIPYLGPFVGAVPAIIVGFLKFQEFSIVLKIIIMFSIVQFVDNNFIQPLILSKGVNLSPVVVIFSIMAGAQIFGVIGMLLAVPITCIIKTTLEILLRKLPISS